MLLAAAELEVLGSRLTIMPIPMGELMIRLSSASTTLAPMVSYLTPLTTTEPNPLTKPATGKALELTIGTAGAVAMAGLALEPPPHPLSKPKDAMTAIHIFVLKLKGDISTPSVMMK